jgi:hypothetical protein
MSKTGTRGAERAEFIPLSVSELFSVDELALVGGILRYRWVVLSISVEGLWSV